MREQSSNETVESSAVCYATLEQWARGQIQRILEEEVTMFLGRQRHARREREAPGAVIQCSAVSAHAPQCSMK